MDGKTDREEEKLEEEKLQEAGPDSAEDGFASEEEPETETPPRKSMGEKIRGLLTKGIGRLAGDHLPGRRFCVFCCEPWRTRASG